MLGPKTTYTLRTVSESKDANGKVTVTTSDVWTGEGVFQPVMAGETQLYAKVTQDDTFILWFDDIPAGQISNLKPKNRIVISSTEYDINGIMPWVGIGAHYQVGLKLVS